MPDLRAFEALVAIARAGSLGAAGRELGIPQQTVSARLAALETSIGVQLVIRTNSGSKMLPAGMVVVEWAEQLIEAAERVDIGIVSLSQKRRTQVIRVAASLTVAEQLMPRWLVSLRAAAKRIGSLPPDVILTAMNSSQVAAAVQNADADLGFVEGPTVPQGLQSKIVAHDRLVVLVTPDHEWVGRNAPITVRELSETPLVLREYGSGTRESLQTALLRHGSTLTEPALELSSVTAIRAAVLAGGGPTVLSHLSAADDLALRRLRSVPVADLNLRRSIKAVWRGAKAVPAGGVRDLLGHIEHTTGRDGRSTPV